MIDLVAYHPIAISAIVLAAAVLVLAARALLLGYPPAVLREATLTRRQQAIVAACADAFFPPGGAIPVSGTEAGLVRYLDAYVRRLDARGRFLVGLLFLFIELGPFAFGPRRRRFTRLALADRIELLRRMGESDLYFLRVSFLSMRTMLTMGYLSNARVASAMQMEIDPAPFEERAPSRAARDDRDARDTTEAALAAASSHPAMVPA